MATRGERNNNPGNIDQSSTKFQGEVDSQDSRFKAFSTPVMGIRALAKVLLTYFNVHGLDTVQGIINRWAPGNENDTGAYVKDVSTKVGVAATDILDLTDAGLLTKIVKAIIQHENGGCIYTEQQLEDGVDAAL